MPLGVASQTISGDQKPSLTKASTPPVEGLVCAADQLQVLRRHHPAQYLAPGRSLKASEDAGSQVSQIVTSAFA
jgi:hypothetical protein